MAIHGSQRMNPNDFIYPLTLPPVLKFAPIEFDH